MSGRRGDRAGTDEAGGRQVLCVDFGSTFTKAALVDVSVGALLATASHPTTTGTDLMEALDALERRLVASVGGTPDWEVRACSSAGGGLRVAVVGNEQLVTSEAGRQVATSSGGWVVHVASGVLDDGALDRLRAARPDLVLLVGGTDGGNTKVLRANAAAIAGSDLGLPVVLAGNMACQDDLAELFAAAGTAHVVAANVLPEIGVVRAEPARAAIREAFVRHVIGGKHLSRREEFTRIVRGATPDLVLRGVEVLAQEYAPDGVVVVDVGGATTDVHSVLEPDPEEAGLRRDVVASLPVSRTVEGDLGLRWNAPGIVRAAVKDGLLDADTATDLRAEADRRAATPGLVASTDEDLHVDERLAALAVTLALRRHAGRSRVVTSPTGRAVEQSGKDLRTAALLVGSGGLLRHGGPGVATRVLSAGLAGGEGGGWMLPERPRLVVDRAYVLAAVGLLADDHPRAAAVLAAGLDAAGLDAGGLDAADLDAARTDSGAPAGN